MTGSYLSFHETRNNLSSPPFATSSLLYAKLQRHPHHDASSFISFNDFPAPLPAIHAGFLSDATPGLHKVLQTGLIRNDILPLADTDKFTASD